MAKERTIPEQQERGLGPPNSMTQATPIYAGGLPGTPPDVVPDPFPPPSPEPDVPGFPEPDPDPDPLDPEPTPAPIN